MVSSRCQVLNRIKLFEYFGTEHYNFKVSRGKSLQIAIGKCKKKPVRNPKAFPKGFMQYSKIKNTIE